MGADVNSIVLAQEGRTDMIKAILSVFFPKTKGKPDPVHARFRSWAHEHNAVIRGTRRR